LTFSVSCKKEGSKLLISVNGELWRSVSPRLFGHSPHFDLGSFEELEEMEYRSALNFAVRSLSAKAQHSLELHKKLLDLGVSTGVVERVLSELVRLGVLDDRDWVEMFIRSLISRNLGMGAIRQKFFRKGIPSSEYEAILCNLLSQDVQKAQIQKLITSKYRAKDLSDPKQKDQVIKALARRGFSWDLISSMIIDE